MEGKKVTLEDLGIKKSESTTKVPTPKTESANATVKSDSKYKKVNMSDFVKIKEHVSPQKEFEKKEMQMIEDGIEHTKKDMMDNIIRPFKEACIAASLESDADAMSDGDISDNGDNMEETLNNQHKNINESLTRKNASDDERSREDDLKDLLSEDDSDDDSIIDDEPELEEEKETNEGESEMKENKPDTFMEDPDETVKEEVKPKKKNNKISATDHDDEVKEAKEVHIPDAVKLENEEEDTSKDKNIKAVEATKTEIKVPEFKVPEASDHIDKISDDDLKELLDTESDSDMEETEEEKAARKANADSFRKEVFEKIGVPATIDRGKIKKFRIATKPVSVNKVLSAATKTNKLNTATWPLPNTGRLITFSALSGEEIENLNPDAHDKDMSTDMINRLIYNTIFDHLVDPAKPKTMEEWLQTINWFDSLDMYFAVYLATFKNSNFVTYACGKDKCHKIFLKDINYQDMIKYTDEKAEKDYKRIMKTAIDATPEDIPEDIVPINDKFAVGFRAPSIFDIVFGTASLDKQFLNKYATTIGNISYMANIYYIKSDTLFPVDCKAVKDDFKRTMRNRIVAYYNILKTFTPDEYSVVTRTISEINENNRTMATFRYPDAKCPVCGTEIKMDEATNPLSMLFIRHQLVQLASSMTE